MQGIVGRATEPPSDLLKVTVGQQLRLIKKIKWNPRVKCWLTEVNEIIAMTFNEKKSHLLILVLTLFALLD